MTQGDKVQFIEGLTDRIMTLDKQPQLDVEE